jgi:hypothetical protein
VSLPRGRSLDSVTIEAYMAKLTVSFMLQLLNAGLHFKHAAYNNEKEYRFLEVYPIDLPPQFKLRVRNYSFIHYREFDWKTTAADALKEIVIGPAGNQPMATEFARECLRKFRPANVDVVRVCDSIPSRLIWSHGR